MGVLKFPDQGIVTPPLMKTLLHLLPIFATVPISTTLFGLKKIQKFTKVKKTNNSPYFFSSLTLTLDCCHPQVHSLLHSLRQLLLISEALHCKRQIIPLRNPAKPVLFAVPGSQTPPAPRPRLKGPWLMCINEVNLLATR